MATQIPTAQNNYQTGAAGENSALFRGPEYYRNLNTTFGPNGNIPTNIPNIPGSTPSATPSGTPSTIPLGVATSTVPPMQLPSQNQGSSQNATNIQGSMGFLAQPNITSLNQLGQATQVANQNFNTALGLEAGVMNELANFGQRKQQIAGEYGIADLTSDLREVKGKYDSTQLSYRRAKEEAMNNPNLTADMKSARISEIERKEASQIADIGIDFNLKQGRLTDAKNLMNDQIELELEPLKIKAQYFTSLKNDYKDFLTTAQNRQLDNLARKEERAYQERKAQLELANEAKLFAAGAGTPTLQSGQPDIAKKVALTLQLAKKDVPSASAALGVLNSLQKFATDNKEGNFIGAAPIRLFGKLRGKEARSERLGTRSNIEAVNLKVQQWASGASLTEEQTKQVKRLTPDKNDTDFQIRNKINQLTDLMQTQIQSELASKGVYYQPETIDWFAPTPTQQLNEIVGNDATVMIPTQNAAQLNDLWNSNI